MISHYRILLLCIFSLGDHEGIFEFFFFKNENLLKLY
jgi:hypothetical protein